MFITLDDPHATNGTVASGINDAGQIVGVYFDATGEHGFVWTGTGVFTTLDDPLATNGTVVSGINDAGQIVGAYFDATGEHGFLLNGGTYFTIDDPLAAPGTPGTEVLGINDAGQIVGGYADASGTHGFVMVTAPNPPPPAGTTADMILRHDADGLYEIYDIGGNALLTANFLGQVGTEFQVAGLGRFFGSDTTDMLLRSATTGQFEVYDIGNNNKMRPTWARSGSIFSSRASATLTATAGPT
jgi:probable HAF family extracellular repeat protein